MENNNETQEIPIRKGSWKNKLKLIIVLLIIGFGLYEYFWYRGVQKVEVKANSLISTAAQYEVLQNSVSLEYERCQQLLLQTSGNFDDFAYCKKFVSWVDSQKK
jgi:predicted negative regulator of RcsB-dependent stress response